MNGKKCFRTHLQEQGKIQDCSNYLRKKTHESYVKLWKLIKIRTQRQNSIELIRNNAKRSKMEAIHLTRQRTDYYTAGKRNLQMVFIYKGKAYNKVLRKESRCTQKEMAFPKNTFIECKIYIMKSRQMFGHVKSNKRFFNYNWPSSRLGPQSLSFCNDPRIEDSIDTKRCVFVHGVC